MRIEEIVIVEGKYDKIKLDSIFDDSIIMTTEGFKIFKNKEKRMMIRKYAAEKGVVILTDSDGAGLVIRNHIKNVLSGLKIKNAYIPEIKGKEKRKDKESKAGLLGVEGVDKHLIVECLRKAGCLIDEKTNCVKDRKLVTVKDLYNDGFVGKPDSRLKRERLLEELSLPRNLSTKSVLESVNLFWGYDGYKKFSDKIFGEEGNGK